jgi:flagellar motor switch protein FliN/FliY
MNQAAEPLLRGSAPSAESRTSPPTAHVIAMSELAHPRTTESEQSNEVHRPSPLLNALGDPNSPLRHVKAKLTVCVGTVELTVGELLGAKAQQVLRLDRTVEQPVDVLLEGQIVARGMLVAVDEYFGVRITELPIALDGSLSSRKA